MAALKGQPAPKPGSVGSAVPGKEEASEFGAFLDSYNPTPTPQGEESEFTAALGASAPAAEPVLAEEVPQEESDMGILDGASRVLDYPGGFMRAGLANSAGMAMGKGLVVNPEDLKAAAKGQGPSSDEYLRRLGVSEGGSFDVPGIGKVSQRSITGLALDIGTDPLIVLSKLAKGSPYIKKLLNAPGAASEALGKAIYKSALPAEAKEAAEAILAQGGPVGGTAKIAQKVDEMSETMGKVRKGMYDRATELGVTIDPAFGLKNAEAVLKRHAGNRGLAPAMQELGEMVNRYKTGGPVSIDEVSRWKTSLYDSLPKSAFTEHGKLKGVAQEIKGALAADFRQLIVKAGNKAEKGLGDSINALNEKWGTLLDAYQPLQKAIKAEAKGGGALGRQIDNTVLATGGVRNFIKKKAFDIATSAYAKTLTGRALMAAGEHGIASRAVINAGREGIPEALLPNEPEE